MAILNAPAAAENAAPPHAQPADKPPLFARTIIPKGAISRTISCSLLPPHALSRASSSTSATASATALAACARASSPPSLKSCRQVVVSTDTSLQVFAVDDDTLSLRPLTDVMLFTSIYDIAAVSTPVIGRDVLVVLSASAKISFMQFDDSASRMRCSGQVSLIPPNSPPIDASLRSHPRLLATHPRKRMVAFAPLQSRISVFPVLFLSKRVNAGKIASVSVDGVVLSLDFLEDDEGVPGDAILLALLQRGKHQIISLYTVGVPPDSGGGLSVTFVGSMITCASHPDDVAVARATSKITGQSVRPTPPAVAVTRLPGCPFLFAVFVHGKIIAGDARSVIVNAHSGDSMPMSVRIEDDITLPARSTRLDDFSPVPVPVPILDEPHVRSDSPDRAFEHGDAPDTPNATRGSSTNADSSTNVGAGSSSGAGTSFSTTDGFVTPNHTPVNRTEPPSAPLQRRPRRFGRDDIPPLPPLSRRSSVPGGGFSGERNPGEDYLSYLFVPAYITLDVGDTNGVATAWVDARDHFRDETGDGNGLYFVMESGAMYALKWSDSVKDGARTFRIPGGERTRTSPKRNFCVEYIGDVGPASSIASLDRRLIFIANDCADSSLRRLHLPGTIPAEEELDSKPSAFKRRLSKRWDGGRYGLEVRQEFLNLAPISDFVIVPPRSKGRLAVDANLNPDVTSHVGGTNAELQLRPNGKDKTAQDHVLHGDENEAEMLICSGTGRHGCVRIARPGAPVSIFAATEPTFKGCNDMWSVRFATDAIFDAGIVLSFSQATRMMLATPPSPDVYDEVSEDEAPPVIASLVDGTRASGLVADTRSIYVGLLEDGVIAQVHERGVRLIFLQKAGDIDLYNFIINGELHKSLVDRTVDWSPPDDGCVSMGTVGAGFILLSIIKTGNQKCMLNLLKCYRGTPDAGLCVVSSSDLDVEVSSLEIPEWTRVYSDTNLTSPRLPPMAVVGTYKPSIEVYLLGPTMDVVATRIMYPWSFITSPNIAKKGVAGYEHLSDPNRPIGFSKDDKRIQTYNPSARSDMMTAVPQSTCSIEVDGRRKIFAGLRDGSVISLSVDETESIDMSDGTSLGGGADLLIDSHRKLGDRPVTLKVALCAVGRVVIGQAERPWMGVCTGGGRMKWTPLAFTETQAACSLSVPGAERCCAIVAEDNSFYICGLRRQSDVSIRSIHIGATPRRVLSLQPTGENIVVATSCDPINRTAAEDEDSDDQLLYEREQVAEMPKHSELRIYSKRERALITSASLLSGELTHVLLGWMQYIVVGTSLGLRSYETAEAQKSGKRGRLLLYSLQEAVKDIHNSAENAQTASLELCCEVVLPGAVLAGDVNEDEGLLVVSCNDDVIVFAISKPQKVLVEIARASSPTLVVSVSFKEDMICIVDRKASISLFHLKKKRCRLVRDRSDHRRRIMSDATLVDRTLAIGVDRFGALITIGYADGDEPPSRETALVERSAVYPVLTPAQANIEAEAIASAGVGPGMTGSANLGEEFDVIHLESESENTQDGSYVQPGDDSGENPNNDDPIGDEDEDIEETEEDPMPVDNASVATSIEDGVDIDDYDDNGNDNDVIDDDNMDNEENDNEDDDDDLNDDDDDMEDGGGLGVQAIGGGTDENEQQQQQQNDDGAEGVDVVAGVQGGMGGEGEGVEGLDELGPERSQALQRIPRNLKCHHAYNMQDTALRIRLGTFSRAGRAAEMNGWGSDNEAADLVGGERCFSTWSTAAFCGTLGGSLVSTVGMSRRAFALLSAVETEMSGNAEIAGPGLGSGHKRFRAAYGPSATGVVDGDLLVQFEGMRDWVKKRISKRLGLDGEHGVLHIEGLIRDLYNRVC